MEETKLVYIDIRARTQVSAAFTVQVPSDFDTEDPSSLDRALHSVVGGSEFQEDTDCWDRTEAFCEEQSDKGEPDFSWDGEKLVRLINPRKKPPFRIFLTRKSGCIVFEKIDPDCSLADAIEFAKGFAAGALEFDPDCYIEMVQGDSTVFSSRPEPKNL